MSAVGRLKFHAFSLAMQAKSGTLEPDEAASLMINAAAEVDESDALYRCIATFAEAVVDHTATPADQAAAGDDLLLAIDKLNVPTPPDTGRADIHG